MSKAPASTRAYEHATFSMGLVNIPISVYSGTDNGHGISRKWFVTRPVLGADNKPVVADDGKPVTDDYPVGYSTVCRVDNSPVDRSEILTKIETDYGFVFVEDHEIEHLFETTPKSIIVKEFQPQHLFYQGHYVPKSLYFVEASKMTIGKRKVENKTAQRALATLFEAMRREGALAVVEFTTRGTPKPAILLPNGTLWLVYHTDELREQRELPEVEVNPAEADLMVTLMKSTWGTSPLDLTDTRTELIQHYADEKARNGDFGRSEEPEGYMPAQAESTDLAALLQASLEQAQANKRAAQ